MDDDDVVDVVAIDDGTADVASVEGRTARRWPIVVIMLAAIGLVAGVLTTSKNSRQDADATLASAQGFVRETTSFRFRAEIEAWLPSGAQRAERPAQRAVKGTLVGEVSDRKHHRARLTAGGFVFEQIRLGPRLFTYDSLDDRWIEAEYLGPVPLEPQDVELGLETVEEVSGYGDVDRRALEFILLAQIHFGQIGDNPLELRQFIQDAADPVVVRRGDGTTTLKARLPFPAAFRSSLGRDAPPLSVELDIDDDNRPSALRANLAKGSHRIRVELRFSDWGEDITIERPDGEVFVIDGQSGTDGDERPGPEHFGGLAPVAPTYVPSGYTPELFLPAGTEDCPSAVLSYRPPGLPAEGASIDDDGPPSLGLALTPDSCEGALAGDPFEVGVLGSMPARRVDDSWEVHTHGLVVQLHGSLPTTELARVADSLQAITIEDLLELVR